MQNIIKTILLILMVQENFVKCPNMDELRASVSVEEQRAFIKISVLLDKAANEIHDDLQGALGNRAYSLRYVEILTKRYWSRERTTSEDLPRSGHPPTADTPDNRERLQALMVQSRAWRLDDLVDELGVSHGPVWHMLHEMNYRKVASRYVSHVLTHARKQLCMLQLQSSTKTQFYYQKSFYNFPLT